MIGYDFFMKKEKALHFPAFWVQKRNILLFYYLTCIMKEAICRPFRLNANSNTEMRFCGEQADVRQHISYFFECANTLVFADISGFLLFLPVRICGGYRTSDNRHAACNIRLILWMAEALCFSDLSHLPPDLLRY